MGANCCVAMRDKPLPDDPRFDISTFRNVRYSPSWSFRWDNRTHIEGIMDNPARFSRHGGGDVSFEIKSGTETETDGLSNEGSPLGAFDKFGAKTGITHKSKDVAAYQSIGCNSSPEEKGTIKSTGSSDLSIPSSSSLNLDPSSSQTHSLPSDPTSSRQSRRSPGYQLSRQVLDSRIPCLKSLNEKSSPEGRQSFVLSISGNDLSMGRSQGGSYDGWSMRTFTELVASSQRDRWSFDSESLRSIKGKLARSNTQQTCVVCSKLLKERSPWSTQKIVCTSELSVVAVLVCGHVYHADCLESVTSETDRFEPPCPVCNHGEKSVMKLSRDEMKARSKISRIAAGDADGSFDPISVCQKEVSGKGPRMGASSSLKSSLGRPFLRRHFSLGVGSRLFRSATENETARKKGFWARYMRD